MLKRLKRVHLLQSLDLRFKDGQEGIAGLARLSALARPSSLVEMDNFSLLAMGAILNSHNWNIARKNRTFQVRRLQLADDAQLISILRDVESMSVGDHGATGLCSGRLKKQEEELQKLLDSIVTQTFFDEIADWGVNLNIELKDHEDPVLDCILSVNGTPFATISLDGFSGRMGVDGIWGNELYNHPEQMQKLIRETLEKKLEYLTA